MRDNSRFSREKSSFRYNSGPGKGSNTGSEIQLNKEVSQGVKVNLWKDQRVKWLRR